MAMLLAKKIGMTRIYDEAGKMVPATVMLAGPCIVTQVKTLETDGYNAVQMAFDDVKPSRRKVASPVWMGPVARPGNADEVFSFTPL